MFFPRLARSHVPFKVVELTRSCQVGSFVSLR